MLFRSMLQEASLATGASLPETVERFGAFLAPHLLKVAGTDVDPSWTLLDLLEHTESIIHAMVRIKNPGATPPVLEALRVGRAVAAVLRAYTVNGVPVMGLYHV